MIAVADEQSLRTEYEKADKEHGGARSRGRAEDESGSSAAAFPLLAEVTYQCCLYVSLQPRCFIVIGLAQARTSAKKRPLSRRQGPEGGKGNQKYARGIKPPGAGGWTAVSSECRGAKDRRARCSRPVADRWGLAFAQVCYIRDSYLQR